VYRLFGTPFGIKITPLVIQYIILSNKWGAVQIMGNTDFLFLERKKKCVKMGLFCEKIHILRISMEYLNKFDRVSQKFR
ncbi:hypothetical protein, partial [Anaerotignum lactatifermentans]|uniref:hypothetical protein n=2 Tax=Anaerotignum lactatifermentans TaxID=160404 RepID=UPI001A9AD3C5